jgi:pyruvate dehydrogenase E2 component (dihydrolipoamide acetyltransferase)
LIPHTPTRRAIGDRVERSRREIPHFDLFSEADITALHEYREQKKSAKSGALPTYNDILIYIVARLLPDFPVLNAWYEAEGVRAFKVVNVGFVVHTHEGVVLPTVFDADRKSLDQISQDAREMTQLARAGKLRASLQRDAGFTLSNIGPVGIDAFNAIISPPQTGILAVGSIAPRPVVIDGGIAPRLTAWMALTVDHRVVDGVVGAEFLAALRQSIESWSGEET